LQEEKNHGNETDENVVGMLEPFNFLKVLFGDLVFFGKFVPDTTVGTYGPSFPEDEKQQDNKPDKKFGILVGGDAIEQVRFFVGASHYNFVVSFNFIDRCRYCGLPVIISISSGDSVIGNLLVKSQER
jgi:hypothetical protein